jgi:hypothetical protein
MRLHKPSPATAIASLALFVALGGTAIAAKHYLINSTRQINPKVLKKLRGAKGAVGAPGAQGKQGPQGVPGVVGGEGKQGPIGPSNAYTASNTGFTVLKFPEEPTLASVAVPAGSYVVSAKAQAINETTERQLVSCSLGNDVNEVADQSSATVEPISGTHWDGRETVAVQVDATLATAGDWRLKCSSSANAGTVKVDEAQISATQVGTLSSQ